MCVGACFSANLISGAAVSVFAGGLRLIAGTFLGLKFSAYEVSAAVPAASQVYRQPSEPAFMARDLPLSCHPMCLAVIPRSLGSFRLYVVFVAPLSRTIRAQDQSSLGSFSYMCLHALPRARLCLLGSDNPSFAVPGRAPRKRAHRRHHGHGYATCSECDRDHQYGGPGAPPLSAVSVGHRHDRRFVQTNIGGSFPYSEWQLFGNFCIGEVLCGGCLVDVLSLSGQIRF